MPEIKTMKIVVSLMTLLIAVMFGLVLYGINRNAQIASGGLNEPAIASTAWQKALPAGARLVSISAAGLSLAALADTPEGRKIYLFDPKSGELRGTLVPAP